MPDRVRQLLERLAQSGWLLFKGVSRLLTQLYEEWMVLSPLSRRTSRLEQGLALTVFLILIAVNGLERLALGRHWPSDVLAALIIGLLWLAVLILAVRRSEAAE